MKRFTAITLLACLGFSSVSCSQTTLGTILQGADKVLKSLPNGLSADEIGAGLKEALQIGIAKGSDSLSKKDGFFLNPKVKIPFPAEVQTIENTLRKVGLGSEVDKFVLALNRGAEQAANEAKPIFLAALKSMTIKDAISILKGDQDAATIYLKKATNIELNKKFQPIVEKALNNTNATKYYGDVATLYNKIPFVKGVNTDLPTYTTQKAIDGLFIKIAEEELQIRQNPVARVSDLLKKVFGS